MISEYAELVFGVKTLINIDNDCDKQYPIIFAQIPMHIYESQRIVQMKNTRRNKTKIDKPDWKYI